MNALEQLLSNTKIVDNRALNLVGAQPVRALLARTAFRLQAASRSPEAIELARDGILICPNFLPDDVFAATVEEAQKCVDSIVPRWLHEQGTTMVRHFPLHHVDADRFPRLSEWGENAPALGLVAAAERRSVRGRGSPLIEDITQGDATRPDPQHQLHADTVFHTHKVWLYLTDVDDEHGPLTYVPGSHRFDGTRLLAEYLGTTRPVACANPSRRVHDDEVRKRGLEPRVVRCPRNTLVIANTSGYHRRAPGSPGAVRRALHMSFRLDPFRYPLPPNARRLRDLGARVASPLLVNR